MPELRDIRLAIKATLEASIPGLNVYTPVPGSATLPAIAVVPVDGDFETAFGNAGTEYNFFLDVAVGGGSDDIGQENLDPYISPVGDRSVKAAIMANPQLGRTDVSAHVRGWTNYGARFEWAGDRHVGARLRLYVVAKNL